jgi:hypothetical protein
MSGMLTNGKAAQRTSYRQPEQSPSQREEKQAGENAGCVEAGDLLLDLSGLPFGDAGAERLLSRQEAAVFLTSNGNKIAPATLAKFATVGGGPTFEYWGRRPLYRAGNLLSWARSRCSGPRRSTSDPGTTA